MGHAACDRDERILAAGHDVGHERLQKERLEGKQRVEQLLHRSGRRTIHTVGMPGRPRHARLDDRFRPARLAEQIDERSRFATFQKP